MSNPDAVRFLLRFSSQDNNQGPEGFYRVSVLA